MHVLVAGSDCGSVAEEVSKVAGVSKVLVADNAAYANVRIIVLTRTIFVCLRGSSFSLSSNRESRRTCAS